MAYTRDFLEVSETGNWNTAKEYSVYKIMRYQFDTDEYLTLAKFGVTELYEEIFQTRSPTKSKNEIRIDAFKWLIHSLLMLISNTLFALDRKPSDKNLMKSYQFQLREIEKEIPSLYNVVSDNLKKSRFVRIKEKEFSKQLLEVSKIKEEINEPLNKSDLIFTHREVFDPKEYKKKIFQDAISRG